MGIRDTLVGIPGGPKAIALFALALTAFVAQSEGAQYVQTTRHYRKPFMLLWLSHSSFILIFPLHLVLLRLTLSTPLRPVLRTLEQTVRRQVEDLPFASRTARKEWPWGRGVTAIVGLTLGVTAPAGLWYLSVPLTSMTSITTLFNTSALWAYLLSVAFLGEAWAVRKIAAVVLATVGVSVIAYGGSDTDETGEGRFQLLGDLLAIIGAFAYGLYEVCYKKYFSLEDRPATGSSAPHRPSSTSLPFALHPNLITTCLGISNIVILFPVFFILHVSGLEHFQTPWSFAADRPDEGSALSLTLMVALVGTLGVVYNGAFMVLLSLWGPVVASVGNLLTIILIAATDAVLFSSSTSTSFSLPVLLGGILVASAFAVLVWDMTRAAPADASPEAAYESLEHQEEQQAREGLLDEELALAKTRSKKLADVGGGDQAAVR